MRKFLGAIPSVRCSKAILGAILGWAIQCTLTSTAHAAELDPDIQRQIRAATFEVVQLKPADGEVIYERPLPMELMPFRERTDAYRPIGTAFAIAPNRFVTAGHVIQIGSASQFGPPALRDSDGKVYAIGQVLEFSAHEDFAVFSVRDPPAHAQYLKPAPKPQLNDTVFAVGNALGEGLVIRDGVYTSDTPEEQDGKWNWIRFTAAASPGNSGGPLVDRHGQLLGVVLRKSPSENLNYALSIGQVLGAKEGEGRISSRAPLRLPLMETAETLQIDERFNLPLGLADFYETLMGIVERATQRGSKELLAHNAAHLFPHGAGSERMLHTIERSAFPAWLREQNGQWSMTGGKPRSVQLDHNGFVELNGDMIRMHAPDDVGLGSLYADSKLDMDLILKAYALHRVIGSESVRVTSLGKARKQGTYTDSYGRVWESRAWAVPYDDSMLTVISLPTPEGYAGVYFRVPTRYWKLVMQEQEMLLDYVLVTMEGSLSRWQSYLAQKGVQPKAFESLKLEITGDQQLRFHSRRCELEVSPQLMKLDPNSVVRLNFAFFNDGDKVVWDVGGLSVADSMNSRNALLIWRRPAPSPDLPEGFQSDWRKLEAREFPYDATISTENGATRIATTASGAGTGDSAKIIYGLRVVDEGTQPQEAMRRKLDLLQHAFKQLEH